MSGVVCVTLRTLSGVEQKIEAVPETTIKELKNQVAQEWEALPDCLKLILGTDVLEDTRRLSEFSHFIDDYDGPVAVLSLLALISLDAVHDRLQSGNSHVRHIALITLIKMTPKGSESTLDAVTARLKDFSSQVRQTALQMLGHIANKGDPRAIAEIKSCLDDRDRLVRLEALAVLPALVEKGNEDIIDALCARLDDQDLRGRSHCGEDISVQRRAIDTLAELAEPVRGDMRVVGPVSLRLLGPTPGVRILAAEAVGKLADRGSQDIIGELITLCEDDEWPVKVAAIGSLSILANQGDESAVVAVLKCLECDCVVTSGLGGNVFEGQISRVAFPALARLALPGDVRVVNAAVASLKTRDCDTRRVAIGALSSLAEKDHSEVIAAVGNCLEDKELRVRQAAVEALPKLMSHAGEEHAVSECFLRLAHVKADVRQAAVQAFANVVELHDESAITALVARLEDQHQHVRLAAMDGLVHVSGPGNSFAVGLVSALLEHRSQRVQCTAQEALAQLK